VVHLAEQHELAAAQSVDHPDLPQRPTSTERAFEDLRAAALELPRFTRRRQAAPLDVVVDAEMMIVHPHRTVFQRNCGETPAVRRNLRQSRGDVLLEKIDAEGAIRSPQSLAVDDDRGGDVHVRVGPLEGEKRLVEDGQRLVEWCAPAHCLTGVIA